MNIPINTKTKTTVNREPKTSNSISLQSNLTEVEKEQQVISEHVKRLHDIRRYTNRRKKKRKMTK